MNNHGAAAAAGVIGFILFVELAAIVLIIAGTWKVFTKAGHPGWAAIIPFYNLYILCLIGGKPGWWFILCCIPLIGIVFFFLVTLGVARNFGKCVGFTLGLLFLPFIFYPILGFGGAAYGQPAQPVAA